MMLKKIIKIACLSVLTAILVTFLILVILEASGAAHIFSFRSTKCTKACLELDNVFKKYIDKTQDPCQDFSKFVCNTYVKTLENESRYENVFDDMTDKGYKKILHKLNKTVSKSNPILVKHAKRVFQSCTNREFLYNKMDESLYKQIKRLGPFPLLDSHWREDKFNWVKLYRKMYYFGIILYTIVGVGTTILQDNYSRMRISLRQGYVLHLNDEARKEKKDVLLTLMQKNNIKKLSDFDKQLNETFEFNDKLANIISTSVTSPTGLRKIRKLESECSDFNWFDVANIPLRSSAKLKRKNKILVYDVKTICETGKVLQNNKRALANFLLFAAIEFFNYLISSYQQAASIPDDDQYRLMCAKIMGNSFPIGISYVYMKKYEKEHGTGFKKDIKENIVRKVRKELSKIVGKEATWINHEARSELKKKIKKIKFHLGLLRLKGSIDDDMRKYEEMYKKMSTNKKDILHNLVEISKATLKKYGESTKITFLKVAIKTPSISNVIPTNAWYQPNYVTVSYAMISERVYKHGGPKFFNFGALTHIIAHEFSHSCDDKFYSYNVKRRIESFWSKDSEKEFSKRQQCLVKTYDKEYDPCGKMQIDGRKTLGENMADLNGILVARRLYEKYLKKHHYKDVELPSFKEYTPQQMFWIGTALLHCQRRDHKSCVDWDQNDVHPIGPKRINMNAKMSEYFAKDWNCPADAPMNPKERCKIFV